MDPQRGLFVCTQSLDQHGAAVRQLCVVGDGAGTSGPAGGQESVALRFASCSNDGTVRVWAVPEPAAPELRRNDVACVRVLRAAADTLLYGLCFLAGGEGCDGRLWRGEEVPPPLMVACGEDGCVHVWDLDAAQEQEQEQEQEQQGAPVPELPVQVLQHQGTVWDVCAVDGTGGAAGLPGEPRGVWGSLDPEGEAGRSVQPQGVKKLTN